MELKRKTPRLTTLFAALMICGALLYFVPFQTNGQDKVGAELVMVAGDSFTVTGSSYTVDEADLSKVKLQDFTIGVLDNLNLTTIHARYNIVAVKPLTIPCSTGYDVSVRFRDGDDTNNSEQVSFEIRTTSITTGGNSQLFAFDSNSYDFGAPGPTVNSTFRTVTAPTAMFTFNFSTNAYWIEAHIKKGGFTPPAYAHLGTIQLRCH